MTRAFVASLSDITAGIRTALQKNGWARLRAFEGGPEPSIEVLETWLVEVSAQLGFAVPQTHAGNLIAHIRNEGADYRSHKTRGHQTNSELAFHSDRCDVNLLLYVRSAPDGGELSVVSYAAAAARLQTIDKDSYELLFHPFPFDLREERIFSSPTWHCRPILWRNRAGKIRGHYIRRFIADSERHMDCPRLNRFQAHALDRFDEVLQSLRGENSFAPAPGDLVALDNYCVMHARTAFVDNAPKPRLALRTWIAPFESEELPVFLHLLAGSCKAGAFRGGVGRGEDYLVRLGSTGATSAEEQR